MTDEENNTPATKGDIRLLRKDLGRLELRADGVDEKLVKLTERIDGVEDRLTKRIDGVEDRLTKRIDDWKVELLTEIGTSVQHSVNVVLEQFVTYVRAVDEKYQDLPARVAALEAHVHAGKP